MSLSETQLSQLERDMDKNHREVMIFSVEELMTQGFQQETAEADTQPPQADQCTRRGL